MKRDWVKYILLALLLEKLIQHIFVSLAFYFNWEEIRSTVTVNPKFLMILGIVISLLFILSLWGVITQRDWTASLVIALAIFDIIGEFVAQGKIVIVITLSFVVAILLLVSGLSYRQRELERIR